MLVGLGLFLTIRLGFWQLDRMQQQEVDNAHLEAVAAMPALDLASDMNEVDLTTMEYRHVIASGEMDYSRQVAIRNQVWVQTWGNEMGFALLTPLILDNGEAVLVERGWVPMKYDSPASWQSFNGPDHVELQGIIRLPVQKGEMGGGVPDPTLGPGQSGLSFWNTVNIQRIQKQLPYTLLSIYIQEAPHPGVTTLPYASIPDLEVSDNTHLGYALQWFLYATLLFFGYPYYIRKHIHRGETGSLPGDITGGNGK